MFKIRMMLSVIFLFGISLSDIVTYSEIGVMEKRIRHENRNDRSHQEGILRRRLMPGGFTDNERTIILNVHNNYRNMTAQGLTPNQPSATNMNELLWDSGLEKVAQNYSSQCIWGHNPNRNSQLKNYATSFSYINQYVGENLFISTGSESMDTILSGIAYWYNEYEYYTFGQVGNSATCQSGQQCGHYTQLVWGNSRYVGCSYSKCSTVKNLPTFTNAILFACDYYFAGNFVGDNPYETGSACSQCPHDRQNCVDGLCSNCPNPAWDTYCCEYCSSSTCSNAINNGLCNSPSTCSNGISSSSTLVSSSATATKSPTTSSPTTASPTTASPTTASPTTASPTTASPTTHSPTTSSPTTPSPTTPSPTTHSPTTSSPTTSSPTTSSPTTSSPTTKTPTTTTKSPTNFDPTTSKAPTSSSVCCLSHTGRYEPFCTSLNSTTCGLFEQCYWSSSC